MNWVSKALYLEEKVKKLEKTLDLLTSHMQVDEDGNIVIEANSFDLHTNSKLKLLSYDNIEITTNSDTAGNLTIETIGNSGNLVLLSSEGDAELTSGSGSVTVGGENNVTLKCYDGDIIIESETSATLTSAGSSVNIKSNNAPINIISSSSGREAKGGINIESNNTSGYPSGNIQLTVYADDIELNTYEGDSDNVGTVYIDSSDNVKLFAANKVTTNKEIEVVTS